MNWMKRIKRWLSLRPDFVRDLKAILLITAATALFFWPVWLAGYRFPRGGGDLWGQLTPVWAYVSDWVRRGSFPLWSTRLMAGDPIIAESQYGLLNPLNWPLFLVSPLPDWLVLARGMLSLWLAGVGLYLYLRRSPVWGLRTSSALVGAFAYMFADPFVAHLGHPQFNDALAWLPWAWWAVDHAARRARAIPIAALTLAALVLSGHGQAAMYAALATGAYALWQSLEGGRTRDRTRAPRRLARLALVGILGAALAAPGVLPGLERLPYTERSLVPQALRRGYEFPPQMLVDFITPAYHGRGVTAFWPAWNRVESGYIGAAALYLAALGLLSHLLDRRVWFLAGLGLLAYLFALGYQGPIYPRVATLPLFDAAWKTARAIYLLSFALAIVAALGVEAFLTSAPPDVDYNREQWLSLSNELLKRGWIITLMFGGILLWMYAPSLVQGVPAGDPRAQARLGLQLAALLAEVTAIISWIAAMERPCWRAGLPLLLLAELVATGALVEMEPAGDATSHEAAIAYLRADPGWFRVDVDAAARGLWSPAALQAAGFECPQGSGNPMELFSYTQFYWAVPHKGAPAYQLFGCKYIVAPKGAQPGGEGIWPVFEKDATIDLHLNTNAMNRVWLVYDTAPVATIEAANEILFAADFDPARVATVEGGPDLESAGATGTIEVWAYRPNRATFGVSTSETALLVLSDMHYPGWRAWVDGAPAPIYKTDGIFRGVIVPPGEHRVEMRFFPRSLRLGLGLAAMAGWLIVVGAGLCSHLHRHFLEGHGGTPAPT